MCAAYTNQEFLFPDHKSPTPFIIDKIRYHSISQWMAASKATLFRDDDSLKRIMKRDTPNMCDFLARSIKGYNNIVWRVNIDQLYYRGVKAKLTQNPLYYLDFLMTKDYILASDLLIKLKREFLMIDDDVI